MKEKTCAFYASDYHFEMMSLPYINKKIEEKENIIILPETNLEETITNLLEKINLKEEKKESILKLNWRNDNLEKIKEIQTKNELGKEIIIFIKGSKQYIQETNQNIKKHIKDETEIKIIDCYNIGEIGNNISEITQQYNKVLQTSGEQEINKI